MFPAQFEYCPARSVDEALSALSEFGADARVLAGGQSLIPAMRYRLARPAMLVDINPIRELDYLREEDGWLLVGARTRDFAIETSATVAWRYPLVADASRVVADPVVRQSGTLVGSICHNDPAGDWPVVATATRAEVRIRGKAGSRSVSIDDFLVDSFETAVGPGEMAIEVRFPVPPQRTSGAYFKAERKVGDFATASAAVQLTLSPDGTVIDAGVAIGAVGPKAIRVEKAEQMLRGARPTADLIRAAADEAGRVADPVSDNRGSAEYKRELASVLVARALKKTLERLDAGGL